MKSIKITTVKSLVKKLIVEASFNLPEDIIAALKRASNQEVNPAAKKILGYILENEHIARQEKLPLCQDCGTVYIKLKIGPDICLQGAGDLAGKLNDAVASAYNQNYLRKSIVDDPLFERENTDNNTPAIIETSFSCEPGLEVGINLKGGGSENCSYLRMLNPASGPADIVEEVKKVVTDEVTKCCPPVIIGLGIGSTASRVTTLAREASFRNLGIRNPDSRYSQLEEQILEQINNLGIGPQGLGGKTTALACNIEVAPCHMATLPVAIFLGCHSLRRASAKISPPYIS